MDKPSEGNFLTGEKRGCLEMEEYLEGEEVLEGGAGGCRKDLGTGRTLK